MLTVSGNSEPRRDAITGEWVIISPERDQRPIDSNKKSIGVHSPHCVFCPGNENQTPPQVLAYPFTPDGVDDKNWNIRVVPNKYPILNSNDSESSTPNDLFFHRGEGLGAHEVVIESRRHNISFARFSVGHIANIFRVYQSRIKTYQQVSAFKNVVIFKNEGRQAGASLQHPHSQLLATSFLPRRLATEIFRQNDYDKRFKECLVCKLIEEELGRDERIAARKNGFVALAPFASRQPYEIWILPENHIPSFECATRVQITACAFMLKTILEKLRKILKNLAFNFVINSPMAQAHCENKYHWRIEIVPRTTKTGGFEWGSGMFINAVTPESAALQLRS